MQSVGEEGTEYCLLAIRTDCQVDEAGSCQVAEAAGMPLETVATNAAG